MDTLSLRTALVEDYKSFTGSFVQPPPVRVPPPSARRYRGARRGGSNLPTTGTGSG